MMQEARSPGQETPDAGDQNKWRQWLILVLQFGQIWVRLAYISIGLIAAVAQFHNPSLQQIVESTSHTPLDLRDFVDHLRQSGYSDQTIITALYGVTAGSVGIDCVLYRGVRSLRR